MSYLNRHTAPKQHLSAELMYFLVVLVAGVATAWWIGHRVGMDLSSITAAASILGLTETGRLTHGAVGYTPSAVETAASVAPYCAPGQTLAFSPSFAALKQRVGTGTMGAPVECEHATSPTADTQQQTTTGLAAYNKVTNTASFTDGWRHWANTPRGLVTWEGPRSDPPAQ